MPKLLDPRTDATQEVSESQLKTLIERTDQAFVLPPGTEPIRLWDNTQQAWAGPFHPDLVRLQYLKKIAFVCSGCRAPSMFRKDVESHIRLAREKAEKHGRAQIRTNLRARPPIQICSGCGAIFDAGRSKAKKHVLDAKEAGPKHEAAEVWMMPVYSMEPPVHPPAVVVNGSLVRKGKAKAVRGVNGHRSR